MRRAATRRCRPSSALRIHEDTGADPLARGVITDGQSVTFTVAVSGVAASAVAGTMENWTLLGTGNALNEVVGSTSGTLTLQANGTASVTINTLNGNDGFAGGTLEFTLTNLPVTDTVTVDPAATLYFTPKVGEVLTGGPVDTTFIGVVDTLIAGDNTLSNVVDVANGDPAYLNTEWITIDSTDPAPPTPYIITPTSTGVEQFEFTNLDTNPIANTHKDNPADATQINAAFMADVTSIISNASTADTNIYNLQNFIDNISILKSDSPSTDLWVTMVDSVASGPKFQGYQTITLVNAGDVHLHDETTSGFDVVGTFNIVSTGTNHLHLDGTSVATTIYVADTDYGTDVTTIHSEDITQDLTLVDAGAGGFGPSSVYGTFVIGGIDAYTDNTLNLYEGFGANTEYVRVWGGATLNITGGDHCSGELRWSNWVKHRQRLLRR